MPVLIDGAQAIAHQTVDVQDLDCDFYVFSSHKLYGPTGVGVLYAKEALLEKMPPYQTGGDMIRSVTFEKTDFNVLPYKFEAGTPNIAGVVGLGAAIDYVRDIGFEAIVKHEAELLSVAQTALSENAHITIYGKSAEKQGVISFTYQDVHAHDVSTILNQSHIAVRAGHHCAMPLMQRLGVSALTRVSFGVYNDLSDVDTLMKAMHSIQQIFG